MASNFCWCLSFCFAGSSYLFVHQQEKEVTYLNYLIYKFIHLVIFSNMYKSTYPKALEPTSMKWLGVFLLPLDGMLVHRKSFPPQFVRFSQLDGKYSTVNLDSEFLLQFVSIRMRTKACACHCRLRHLQEWVNSVCNGLKFLKKPVVLRRWG